jgi:hypothetical protein
MVIHPTRIVSACEKIRCSPTEARTPLALQPTVDLIVLAIANQWAEVMGLPVVLQVASNVVTELLGLFQEID